MAINLGHNSKKKEEDKNKLRQYNRTKPPNCPYCTLYIINLLNSLELHVTSGREGFLTSRFPSDLPKF